MSDQSRKRFSKEFAFRSEWTRILYAWHAEARAEGCIDRTTARSRTARRATATTSFFTHHLRLISLAAVIGAALPVAVWAKARKSHLLSGAPLAGLLPVPV